MEIIKQINENKLQITLAGRLDTTTAPELENSFTESSQSINDIELDFSQLEYVSSAGLRVLLTMQKAMNKVDGKMVIKNVCDEIREVFDITGFSDVLTIQ